MKNETLVTIVCPFCQNGRLTFSSSLLQIESKVDFRCPECTSHTEIYLKHNADGTNTVGIEPVV